MSRQLALESELEQLASLNATADILLDTIQKALKDISKSKAASENTSALLGDWIKILNQTRFTEAALRDPLWEGPQDNSQQVEQFLSQEQRLQDELRALEAENKALADSLLGLPRPEAKRSRK